MALGVVGLIFRPRWRFLPLAIFPVVAAYGAFDELTQPIFRRDAEWGDWYADCTGAAVAVLIISAVQWWMLRSRRAAPASADRQQA
jgi:hypothetical protein